MILQSLTLRGVTVYDELAELDLRGNGVTLVTGPKGAGKSSIVEAVSWCLWGRTLRGCDVYARDGCEVLAVTGDLAAVRAKSPGGRGSLHWLPLEYDGQRGVDACDGAGWVRERATPYESSSKAHDALAKMLMPHAAWRRACVLSAADPAPFSVATDAERKRMVEDLFGFEVFDLALVEVRSRLSTARDNLAAARTTEAAARASLAEAEAAVVRLVTVVPDGVEHAAGAGEAVARNAVAALATARSARVAAKGVVSEARAAQGRAEAEHDRAVRADRVAAAGRCSACGQEIPEARVAAARRECAAASTARRAADVAAYDAEQEWMDLNAAVAKMEERAEAQARTRARYESDAVLRGQLAAARQVAVARGKSLVAALGAVECAVTAVRAIEGAQFTLGLRGVRARILDDVLVGVEYLANAWLARLGSAAVRLRSQTNLKSGDVADKISVELDPRGDGGWRPFEAASGGERSDGDLALMLGLSGAACSARGEPDSTLFFDEAAAFLDAGSAENFAQVMRELATTRRVVVISHSDALAKTIQPDAHVRVEDGRFHDG